MPDVTALYVFGSAATGEVHQQSDVDLAVLLPFSLSSVQLWGYAQEIACMLNCDVDLVDLRIASAVMRMQVIAYGHRLLCQDSEECTKFEDFVFSDYARLNEERQAILADVGQQECIYG